MNVVYMIAATLAALAAWGYLIRFAVATRGSWARSLTGVALVTQGLLMAMIMSFVSTNLWFILLTGNNNWPGRQVVGAGLFFLAAAAVILIWTAFEKAQRN